MNPEGATLRPSSRDSAKSPLVDVGNVNLYNKRPLAQAGLSGFVRAKLYKRNIIVRSIVDSGNLFNTLISEELFKGLGLALDPTDTPDVGTANNKQSIEILGRSQPFQLFLEGIRKAIWIHPYVARGVRHPLNLGRDFLSQEKVSLHFGEENSFLTIAGDSVRMITRRQPLLLTKFLDHRFQKVIERLRTVPLLWSESIYWGNGYVPHHNDDGWSEIVYNTHKQKIPAGTISFIDINIPDHHSVSEIFVEPSDFLQTTRKTPFLNTLTCKGIYPLSGKEGRVAVLNPLEVPVEIPAGTAVGRASGDFIAPPQKSTKDAKQEDIATMQSEVGTLSHKPERELTDKELQERRAYIIEQLKLHENKFLKDKPHLLEEIVTMFLQNFDAVAIGPADFGKTDLTEFEIELEPGAKPIRHKVKPLNPTQLENLRKQLDDWKEADVIEPAVSPWGFRLVPVLKKNGRTRWCVDYRQLNAITIKDSYPLSNITANLEQLQGSRIFSTLDSQGAYHTLPVAKGSRDKTCFVSPLGSYQFRRLPFGVSNAPSAYSRFMDLVLQRLPPGFALGYLDDIVIHSLTMREHLQHLEQVLRLHVDTGLKLNMTKCELIRDKVIYLGHQVSAEGIQMVDSYVQRVLDWEKPVTGKQMRTFLGFIGYYRGFFPDFARLTARMNGERNHDKVQWTEEMEQDFEHIKAQFGKKPIRAYPDYSNPNPFRVTTDYSQYNVAGILSQEQDGKERFIAATGRKCSHTEKDFESYRGELLALVLACKAWEHILRYRKFIVVTDAQALKYLRNLKDPRGVHARWLSYLATFDFDVIHRAGKKNVNADSLSRCNHLPEATPEEEEEATDDIEAIDYQPISPPELKEAQKDDPILKHVRRWVKEQ